MNAKRIAQLAPVALAAIILSPGLVDAKTFDGASSSHALLTAEQITQAIQANTLEQLLSNAVGSPPSAPAMANLSTFLTDLTSSDPELLAKTASGLASLAWDTALDDPAGALALAKLAIAAVDNPDVIGANAEQVGQTIITLAGANRLASRSAATKGIELVGSDELANRIQALASNAAILAAIPDIQSKLDESIQLADAQADLAGFTTAAGPGDLDDSLDSLGLSEFETAVGIQQEASPIGL